MRDDLQDPYYRPRESNAFAMMTLVLIGFTLGMIMIVTLRACDAEPVSAMSMPDCQECHAPDLSTYSKYRNHWKK